MSERPQNKHLKPFKKGQSGNPKGRPKLPGLKDLIEEIGEEDMRKVVTALYNQAKKGNVKAIQEVLDRYYGKTKQEHDITTKGESLNDLSQLSTEELIKRAEATKKLSNDKT